MDIFLKHLFCCGSADFGSANYFHYPGVFIRAIEHKFINNKKKTWIFNYLHSNNFLTNFNSKYLLQFIHSQMWVYPDFIFDICKPPQNLLDLGAKYTKKKSKNVDE